MTARVSSHAQMAPNALLKRKAQDESEEGQRMLPMSSPVSGQRLQKRRFMLKQLNNQIKQETSKPMGLHRMTKSQTSAAHTMYYLVKALSKIGLRPTWKLLQKKMVIQATLKKMMLKKAKRENKQVKQLLHKAFMNMMKNLVFKARLQYYLERAQKRLKEKSFDKILLWG